MPPLLGTEPVELQYSGYERVILERESFVFYRAIEECGEMLQLRTWADVETHAAKWLTASDAAAAALPIGYLLSLEGADSILSWRHLEKSRADGLIALGPVHYGPGIHGSGSASSSMSRTFAMKACATRSTISAAQSGRVIIIGFRPVLWEQALERVCG
jgi:hypothetical protein